MSITPARFADLNLEHVASVPLQIASRACAEEHCLRVESSGARRHRPRKRRQRRLQLTRAECIDAEQRQRAAAIR
jgi:hypothetical protein